MKINHGIEFAGLKEVRRNVGYILRLVGITAVLIPLTPGFPDEFITGGAVIYVFVTGKRPFEKQIVALDNFLNKSTMVG